jgi:hypothetical protein
MKQLLYWGDYNKYSEFTKPTGLVLESQESDPTMKRVKIKVDYAVMEIAGQYKFFAELLYKLRIIYTRQVKTAAVDGTNMFINPEFFDPLTEQQIIFIVCHEVMHCALYHFARIQGRDGFRWNIAGDYEINWLLSEDGVLSYDEIKNTLHGMIEKKYAGKNAEQLYEDPEMIMPPKPEEGEGENETDSTPGGGGGSGGEGGGKKKEVLKPGNIIYDKASDTYGKVNSIDTASGEVDFSPLSKQEAESELKKLKAN